MASTASRKRLLIALSVTIVVATLLIVITAVVTHHLSTAKDLSATPTGEQGPTIYIATGGRGGLKAYSLDTSKTSTAVDGDSDNLSTGLQDVAYDFQKDLVYWSSSIGIYRKPKGGSQVTTVLSANDNFFSFLALDFDWVTTNLYASSRGSILACNTLNGTSLNCVPLLNGRAEVRGIALNPSQGLMFWTSGDSPASVSRAGMDGSDPSVIITGLHFPKGIAIDFQASRLYWVNSGTESRVQSSNLQGMDVQTVIYPRRSSWTYGIALLEGRIYITNWATQTLESYSTAGEDLGVLHNDTESLRHLAISSGRPCRPIDRTNDCKGQRCTNVCVLTPTTFRCVS